MKLKYTLSACVDCTAYVTNAYVPEDRPNLANEILDHFGEDDVRHLVCAHGLNESGEYERDSKGRKIDPEHPDYEAQCEDWFAWSKCECCRSHLSGNRNRLAVLREPNARETGQINRRRRERLTAESVS